MFDDGDDHAADDDDDDGCDGDDYRRGVGDDEVAFDIVATAAEHCRIVHRRRHSRSCRL